MFIGEIASKHLDTPEPMRFEDSAFRRALLQAHVITQLPVPIVVVASATEDSPVGTDDESKVVCPADDQESKNGDQQASSSNTNTIDRLRPSADADESRQTPVDNSDSDDEAEGGGFLLPDYAAAEHSSDSDDDSDDSSESSFEPQGLDDDRSDITLAKRPKFLRDCLAALDSKDDHQVRFSVSLVCPGPRTE